MAVRLTEEEANAEYQRGYNDGRYPDPDDIPIVGGIIDELFDVIGSVTSLVVEITTLGLMSESERDARFEEIYQAGYEQGRKDAEEYDQADGEE